jgi:hypothetical protein
MDEPAPGARSTLGSAAAEAVVPRPVALAAQLARSARQPAVVTAHWSHLIEGLEASSLEFYRALEEAIARREIPDTERARVDYREAGYLSAKREYLRVTRGAQAVDICAAPFGRGFFVSWWLGEARPSPILPTIVALAILIFAIRVLGFWIGGIILVLGFLIVGVIMSQGEGAWHAYFLVILGLGSLWERLFRPVTLYRHDTMLMFQSAFHAAVLEVVDSLTDAKGLRRLSELERKPILREFHGR